MTNKLKAICLTAITLIMAILGGLIVCREAAIFIGALANFIVDSIWPIARAIIGMAAIGVAGYIINRYDLYNFIDTYRKGDIK